MSKDTWNFPTWHTTDGGPFVARQNRGMIFEADVHPFTENMTYVFSFFGRSGWTAHNGVNQTLFFIGKINNVKHLLVSVNMTSTGDSKILFQLWDGTSGAVRYDIELGDEDGSSWLKWDKFYEVAFAFDGSGIKWAVNGSNTPKSVTNTNTPGTLNLEDGVDYLWMYGGPIHDVSSNNPKQVDANWPSLVMGPGAMSTTVLDLDDKTVRDRIWDANGDFIHPFEDGSGWFGAYQADIPESYFEDGSARFNTFGTMTWHSEEGGGAEFVGHPGGLRKQYEGVFDGVNIYRTMAEADASGDVWSDGDEIIIANTTVFVYESALDIVGHNGLRHKWPFGQADARSYASFVPKVSQIANVNPENWVNWDDNSVGTKDVDYILDISAGRARMLNNGGFGTYKLEDSTLPIAGQTQRFWILDQLSGQIVNNNRGAMIKLPAYHNGVVTRDCRIGIDKSVHATNWIYVDLFDASKDTGIPWATPQRIWLYVDSVAPSLAIWTDTDLIPIFVATFESSENHSFYFDAELLGNDCRALVGYFVGGDLIT